MSDFERQLQDDLRAAASRVSPRHTHVGEILTEGAKRAKRRQAQKAIGGVLVAGIAVVGGVAVLTRDDSGTTRVAVANESTDSTGEPTDRSDPAVVATPAPTGDGNAVVVDSNLTWRSVDVDSAEALSLYSLYSLSGDSGSGPFVELSSEPGRSNDYSPVVWTSDDGITWQVTGQPAPITARGVASAGSDLYVVGTGPATAASASGTKGELSLAHSPDAGGTWTTAPIPLDLKSIEDHPGIGKMNAQMFVSDGPSGVIVAVRVWSSPDLSGVPDYDPNAGWELRADGVALWSSDSFTACQDSVSTVVEGTEVAASTDPPVSTTAVCAPTAARVASWAELGVADEDVPYVLGTKLFTFRVEGGATMTPLGTIEVDAGSTRYFGPNLLTSTPTGYVLEASAADEDYNYRGVTFTSPDGVTWTQHEVPVAAGYQPVTWAGGLAVLDQPYDSMGRPTATKLAMSTDGESWSQVNLSTVIDAVPLEGMAAVNSLVGGPTGLTLLVGYVPEEVAAPLDAAPVETDASNQVVEATVVAAVPTTMSYAVLHSADGVHWSIELPDELQDLTGKYAALRQAGNRIVVSVQTTTSGTGPLPDQLALIATPTN